MTSSASNVQRVVFHWVFNTLSNWSEYFSNHWLNGLIWKRQKQSNSVSSKASIAQLTSTSPQFSSHLQFRLIYLIGDENWRQDWPAGGAYLAACFRVSVSASPAEEFPVHQTELEAQITSPCCITCNQACSNRHLFFASPLFNGGRMLTKYLMNSQSESYYIVWQYYSNAITMLFEWNLILS